MTHIKISCGFEADIDEEALDDIEFLEALSKMESGNPTGLPQMVDLFFGKEEKKRFYGALKNEKGRATPAEVEKAVGEIFKELRSKKA